jgi:hypothetical protein
LLLFWIFALLLFRISGTAVCCGYNILVFYKITCNYNFTSLHMLVHWPCWVSASRRCVDNRRKSAYASS